MNTLACTTGNLIWKIMCLPASARFRRNLQECRSAQESLLTSILRRNKNSRYGKEHRFADIRSVDAYRRAVPLTDYDDYTSYIDSIAAGEERALTGQTVELFEPTSGSTAARKLVPYTVDLRRAFRSAVSPWVTSLFRQHPDIRNGPVYWSISPPVCREELHGAIPVGFANDAEYLGLAGEIIFRRLAVQPDVENGSSSAAAFRTSTIAALIAEKELRFISVWSPSFLTLLLDWYLEHPMEVLEAMSGTRDRIEELKSFGLERKAFESIWPRLCVVSCWADATSSGEAAMLKEYLPNVPIQGKGLIATEAIVSIPYEERMDPVLALNSHFFEFIAEDGACLLAHQLERDQAYSVVVTNGGGLYRYRLHDHVLVTGFLENTPCFRFLGKADHVCDLRGEKLHNSHVSRCIDSILADSAVRFSMMAPDKRAGGMGYTLYVQCEGNLPADVEELLEEKLRENPQYRHCVELGQLAPARVFRIHRQAAHVYEERCVSRGMKRGDIKPPLLSSWDGWSETFGGGYVESRGGFIP